MKTSRFQKCLVLILCIVVVLDITSLPAHAYDREVHDEMLEEVFFKNFKDLGDDTPAQERIVIVESAMYLCIDQFNDGGGEELNALKTYGVKDIPETISEISFSGGRTHRSYTHRGWRSADNFLDPPKREKREQILYATVGTVFDFQGNNKQQEAFCRLLYCIHILGDHLSDKGYLVQNGYKLEAGGAPDNNDIVHEIEACLPLVFPDQTHTHKYHGLMRRLNKYDNLLSKLRKSEGGINSDEKFQQKHEYVEKIYENLALYLPEMLKNETFFAEVFY